MGNLGSDDDIRLKICDKSKCCTTKVLSNLLSSEWVKNKKETWDGSKLGNCSSILFDENLATIEVALLKDGKKEGPNVASMKLTGQVGNDKKKTRSYKCGAYSLRGSDTTKSNFCSYDSPSSESRSSQATTTKRPASASLPEMIFKKIDVQMGGLGSDDDMSIKICDLGKCCQTKKLSHLLSSEWVAKKKETWDGSDLGNCSQILFDEKLTSIEVVLLKNGKKSAPEILNMNITGQVGSNKNNVVVFKCGLYKFTKSDQQKSSFCLNSKSSSKPASPGTNPRHQINQVVVNIGDDGTNDDVSLQICQEKSSLECCDTGKLSSTFSDDWSKNDKETWENKKLGACKTQSFDACKGLDVSVKKKSGSDSLKVKDITLELVKPGERQPSAKFVCSNYNIGARDTVKRSTCVLDRSSSSSLSCSSSSRPASPTAAPRPSVTKSPSRAPPKPSRATSGPCLRSGKNCPSSSSSSSSSSEETVSITSFDVEIGSDGSNDPVTVQVCSDTRDVDVCCETPTLSKPSSNNWSRSGKEVWPLPTLGRCAGQGLPTQARTTVTNLNEATLTLTINKKGRDNMQINNFYINTENQSGKKRRFKCGRFLVDKEKFSKECYAQYSKPRTNTTPAGPCLRSGKNCPSTTTRPPFRSGSG